MEPHPARILVLDDEAPIRMTLERLLQRQGYFVTVAKSGEEALLLIERQAFDLLLLDMKLPGMGGLEVARRARALQPTATILLLTGNAALGEAPTASEPERFEQISKTASPEEVLARVALGIGRRASTAPGHPSH